MSSAVVSQAGQILREMFKIPSRAREQVGTTWRSLRQTGSSFIPPLCRTHTNRDLLRNRKTQERTPPDLSDDSSPNLDYWCCWHLYNGLRMLSSDEVHAQIEALDLHVSIDSLLFP